MSRIRTIAVFLLMLSGAAGAQVSHYQARIEPDLQNKSLSGQVTVSFKTLAQTPELLELDAGALTISAVTEHGQPLRFDKAGSKLRIALASNDQPRQVEIRYAGTPPYGMNFLPDAGQVFTAFSTSQWMPCLDAPEARASFALELVLPARDSVIVGNGLAGKDRFHWSQAAPMPSYLYGFAAGDFIEVSDPGSVTLRYLAPKSFTAADLTKIFTASRDMLTFYQDKAGVPYPGASYTQVLVQGSAAQEADGFSLMGEKYGRRVLEDEKKIWLGAHEFAHQWWGNGLSNRDWTHFWLNEGIATFMTAAYLEHRFGRAEYLANIDAAREKYEAIRSAGKDKSLVFPDWDKPSAADRSLVYDKGAYVMHLLREQLGEEKFWAGLRSYTRRYWGKSVTTADFKLAMEQSSGQDLSGFFAQWITLEK